MAAGAIRAAQVPPPPPHIPSPTVSPTFDRTTADVFSMGNDTISSGKAPVRKKGKPKPTAKERRECGLALEKIVSALPLEFRGADPNHIEALYGQRRVRHRQRAHLFDRYLP